jgi:3-keto-disaccharide hydrolase
MPMKAPIQLSAFLLGSGVCLAFAVVQDKVTYDDTPLLPDSPYRVHGERPWPQVVTPGATPGAPPADAVVLFDGEDLSAWTQGDGEPSWTVNQGAMQVTSGGALRTRQEFGDCQVHLEFASPAEVKGDSQGRGNSGVFLMGRYEVQVLDSYQNPTYPDGQCGSMYGQYPPLVNVCRGPGEWQTYDIIFRAPRFEDGRLTEPARLTLLHNGVVVHAGREYIGATTHRQVAKYSPHPPKGPLSLQDHGNPVRYRNIWVRELDLDER